MATMNWKHIEKTLRKAAMGRRNQPTVFDQTAAETKAINDNRREPLPKYQVRRRAKPPTNPVDLEDRAFLRWLKDKARLIPPDDPARQRQWLYQIREVLRLKWLRDTMGEVSLVLWWARLDKLPRARLCRWFREDRKCRLQWKKNVRPMDPRRIDRIPTADIYNSVVKTPIRGKDTL